MLSSCLYYVWLLNEFVKEYFRLLGGCAKFSLGNRRKPDYEAWARTTKKKYIRDVDFPVLENRFESWCNLLCKSLEWRSLKCVNRNLKIKWITIIDTVGDFWVTTEIHLVTVVLWLYMCASWCYFRSPPRSDIIPTSRISLVSQILGAPKWQGN